jgi:hypothetical protein
MKSQAVDFRAKGVGVPGVARAIGPGSEVERPGTGTARPTRIARQLGQLHR